jgi:hypothetical protein
MPTASLPRMLQDILIACKTSLVRFAKKMWNKGVRFGFSERPSGSDEEAATGPSLPAHEAVPRQEEVMSDDENVLSFVADDEDDYNHKLSNADKAWEAADDRLLSSSTAHASHSNNHSFRTTDHSFSNNTLFGPLKTGLLLPRAATYQDDGGYSSLSHDMGQLNTTPKPDDHNGNAAPYQPLVERPQPDFGVPFLTNSPLERDSMYDILQPVRAELETLYETTPEMMPEYNPEMRTNSHAQVLELRLVDIAEFIQQFLRDLPEERRGVIEMRL